MSFVKLWVHAVWATKNRQPVLGQTVREEVFKHIHQNALKKDILMDVVNGYSDHVHCLFRLKNEQNISKVMQLIKGETAFWVNQNKLLAQKFHWQEDYFAVSVSESQAGKVRAYIKGQQLNHQKKSFSEEYDEFIENYNFKQ